MVYRYQNEENLEILPEIMILADFGQIPKFRSCVHFQSAPPDHEMPGRGISVQKPSVHNWGRPQYAGEHWRRLRTTPTTVSNIEDFAILPDVTVWLKSTVERGFGRKVAPGGAIKIVGVELS